MSKANTPEGIPQVPPSDAPQEQPAKPERDSAPAFVEHLLGHRSPDGEGAGSMGEATVSAWTDTAGVLGDGHAARLGASCLLQPAPGDRVLVWSGSDDRRWVLAVLLRPNEEAESVLAMPGNVTVKAPRIAMAANAVHIAAEDFLTSTRNRHAVEGTRTETCDVRVSQIGTDIRRVTTADESVEGTLLQRAGTWISTTMRDARLRARTFLFD